MMVDVKRVLVVEDQPLIAQMLADMLRFDLGCQVVGPAPSVKAAIELAQRDGCDIALVDMTLPDGNGMDVIRWLQRADVRCAAITATLKPPDAERVCWLDKPVDVDALRAFIERPE